MIAQTVRQEGVFSLWRGLTPVLCKQGTNSAVRFTTFGALRDRLRDTWPERMAGTTATMLAGAGSGVVTVCVLDEDPNRAYADLRPDMHRCLSIMSRRGCRVSVTLIEAC